ncbi:MAG: hypothetical protein ABL872_08210 [Lacibacter sp.]
MTSTTTFHPLNLKWLDTRTYLFVFLFAAGNLVLPLLCHLIPSGGLIFLPVYFFTLIASYKFGLKAGLLTAICSPLLNSVLTGMPPMEVLPVILLKSCLLAIAAAYVATTFKKVSVIHLLMVVLAYQIAGSLVEWGITQSFAKAMQDLTIGIPGMLIQVFGGWILLKKLADYEF